MNRPTPSDPDPIIDIGDGTTMKVSDLFQAPARQPLLSQEQIRRIGAMTAEGDRSAALDLHLANARTNYDQYSKSELVEELIRRDRQLANEGKQLADGRMAGKLLRELVRGLLSMADHATLRAVGDGSKAGNIEQILIALGSEPADLRQLRLHGSTLGTGESEESRRAEMERLASGQQTDVAVPTGPRAGLEEGIEKARNRG